MADHNITQDYEELQNILDLVANHISAPYSEATSYSVGQYCTYEGSLWKCRTATSGAWNSSAWQAATVGGQLGTKADLSAINNVVTLVSGDSASVASGTWTKLQSMTMAAGAYLVVFGVTWQASATGYRQFAALKNQTATPNPGRLAITNAGTATQGQGANASMLFTCAEGDTIDLWARQSSGSALTAYPYIEAVKLK